MKQISCLIILLLIPFSLAQTAFGDPIEKESYSVSRSLVDREVGLGRIVEDSIIIKNKVGSPLSISVSSSSSLDNVAEFDILGFVAPPRNNTEINFIIKGTQIGTYSGEISLTGDIEETIPVNISVVNESKKQEFLVFTIVTLKKKFTTKEELDFKVDVKKILAGSANNVTFNYSLENRLTNLSTQLGTETIDITGSIQLRKKFIFPEDIELGNYLLRVTTNYKNETSISNSEFILRKPFLSRSILGIPIWAIILTASLILLGLAGFFIAKKIIERRRKYKMQLFSKTLPKKSEQTFWLGKIAEKKDPAYLEMGKLTTHCVVAGATGGGKSISAQVIIEEALKKNIAVIVFDPTAQWSGMLRKCEDKKMLSFFQKFGLKPNDARSFPGNVKLIKNERQKIDIEKYIRPGQIQIFALNKLEPSAMDVFVASVIVSIFKSDPKEHPVLRTMLVFDEVHRLLPKFGGSGKGFLQIERACREFRKWGFGVMLVSQVLSDFVGEIKANINTEVQMRTRDEADLNRLKTKYGETVLQSLIKASVGVGMFVNPSYNKGKPYFINFRPILHSTRRLSDEILEKYNKYGEEIEDLEYQIEQLEAEKVDTFDMKMELKLVKDKLMTGNFTVVDIYLEGLKPRFEKQWQSLGKKPKKKELELVEASDVEASVKAAEKERQKWEEKEEKPKEKAEKKVDVATKIVKPLTFENGMMISSLKEFKEVLPSLDNDIFAKQKADILKWVESEFGSELAQKMKPAKNKASMIQALETKPQKPKEKEENKEESSDKKEDKEKNKKK